MVTHRIFNHFLSRLLSCLAWFFIILLLSLLFCCSLTDYFFSYLLFPFTKNKSKSQIFFFLYYREMMMMMIDSEFCKFFKICYFYQKKKEKNQSIGNIGRKFWIKRFFWLNEWAAAATETFLLWPWEIFFSISRARVNCARVIGGDIGPRSKTKDDSTFQVILLVFSLVFHSPSMIYTKSPRRKDFLIQIFLEITLWLNEWTNEWLNLHFAIVNDIRLALYT